MKYKTFEKDAITLIRNGYNVTPIRIEGSGKGKAPMHKGWQNKVYSESNIKALKFSHHGIGIITGRVIGVDIDVWEAKHSLHLKNKAAELLYPSIIRVGCAPKLLIVYRCEDEIPKLMTKMYKDSKGRNSRVEILAKGQQFVAFGMHATTNKPYYWKKEKSLLLVKLEDLPEVTEDQILIYLNYCENYLSSIYKKENKKSNYSRKTKNINPIDISIDEVRSTLGRISLESHKLYGPYALWIRVGMALYHQYNGSQDGFDLWNEWSSTHETYNSDDLIAKWPTFNEIDEDKCLVTFASILRLSGPKSSTQKTGELADFLERYILIEKGSLVCDLKDDRIVEMLSLREFKDSKSNVLHEVDAADGKTKLKLVYSEWVCHIDRQTAKGMVYQVGDRSRIIELHGHKYINNFYMPEFIKPKDDSYACLFLEHMSYLFPNTDDMLWFIQWMAFTIFKPKERCKVTPIHISYDQGTGRGWTADLMAQLLGVNNVSSTTVTQLMDSGFNDYVHNTLLCTIHELKDNESKFRLTEQIKDILTNDYLNVNRKYGTKGFQRVYTNFMFFSNHSDALVLTGHDRRINVFVNEGRHKSQEYYSKLYSILSKKEALAQIYYYLKNINIDNFNSYRSRMSKSKEEMMELNKSPVEFIIEELIKDTFQRAGMSIRDIEEYVGRNLSEGEDYSRKQITAVLRNSHFRCARVRDEHGRQRRVWLKPKKHLQS